MKVILLRDMTKLGKRGDVKEVADGYAMNVLIKKGDALRATPTELAKWKAKEDAVQHKKDVATSTFSALIAEIKKSPIVITGKKSDSKGQLFAQIKDTDIADAIFATQKTSIDPKQILIDTPIKSLGKYLVQIKQGVQKETISVEVK
jgi:large subunit ribosomal protein L9